MREYRLTLYRGKWAVTYREGGATRRVSCGTDDRAVAEKVKGRLIAGIDRPADAKVGTLWEAYRKDRDGRAIAETMKWNWKALAPTFGELETEAITVDLCRAYVEKRRKQGRKDGTIWSELNRLRIVMNWAVKRKLIAHAPYIETPPQPDPKDRYLTREEFARLLDSVEAPHAKTAVAVALATGARIEAVLELTWDRVDMERGIIRLHNPFVEKRRKGRATVPINADLMAVLQTAKRVTTGDYVVEYGGRPVKSIKRAFNAAVARAGLEDVTPHVLRHTAAVWMAEAGIPMEEIAQYLGHSDVKTTRRVYARYSPNHLRDASEALRFGDIRPVK